MRSEIAKRYIRQVKRVYSGKHKAKKQFIEEINDAIECYLEQNPEATYSDLLNEFGEPSDLKNMLSFQSASELHRRNMILYWAGIVGICIIIAIALSYTVDYVLTMHDYSKGYYVEYYEENNKASTGTNPITGQPDPTPKEHMNFN